MKYKFDLHILPFFESMYLEDITSKVILEWEDYILSENSPEFLRRNKVYH